MKKGFTLVEIILSIALITIVGVGATIGFIQYNKNSKEKTLNNMSDEILTALRVYIETDSEAKKRIYEDYEGMAITLNKLESEGLIDFGDLDVQDDYVVAMLSNESDCSDITTVNNWDLSNGPLYICSKSNGSQNLFAVGGDAENLSQATREPYYFRGGNAKNFVKLDGDDTLYKILSVETDDSLILYRNSVIGRMNHCPESILRIKEEAQLSIEAKLPGCTGVSIAFMPACHPGLQGQRAYSHRGKDRTQPLHLTDTLPHRGPPSLGPASLVLVSPATAALSIGLLGKDSIQFFFFNLKTVNAAKPPVYSSCIWIF